MATNQDLGFVVKEANGRLSYTAMGVFTLILGGIGAGALGMHLYMGEQKKKRK